MGSLIPFDSGNAKLPAHLRAAANKPGSLASFSGGPEFPVISLKGKVFTLVAGGERNLITNPDDPDTPASHIEVAILGFSPAGNKSAKVFYANGYEEGSTEKPDCFSNDGVSPDKNANSPQAKKCDLCPHNVKGSKPTPNNPQGKACASSKRLAVATVDKLDEPMFLRVPGASVVPLSDLFKTLNNRGVTEPYGVVTKIGFDYKVAYPALTFKPVSFLDAEAYQTAERMSKDEAVEQILGVSKSNEEEFSAPAEPPAKATEKKAAPKPPVQEDDELPTKPKVAVKMQDEAPAEPTPPNKAAKVTADLAQALDDGDIDFDD